ncbi:prepilin-type N-terminal cleavage/methylation domain-containing protein [methane-oxidizing endosymbiont of Gigantopelta aegis]|uniref:prepilin-type N-terminal cleavage/methylation domain-containing protein n=1 Tax=methane-oxidizing endosymbiont of Gigantopelta aegis TaxID=2794938 RepID=UPI0018DC6677|nr:prepilin-type N-terminal cleavage/methylation domain-containing protein [methane-oxidizing endosymbiont of Gigantopelta aegis]
MLTGYYRGFTLLELLVVLTLLMILSGTAIYAYEGLEEQGRDNAVVYEMSQIRNALLQFRRDSGSHDFPGQGQYDCDDAPTADSNSINPAIEPQLPSSVASLSSADKVTWCRSEVNFWMLFKDPLAKGWNRDTHRGWNGPYLLQKDQPLDYENLSAVWGIVDAYGNPYLLKDLDNDDKARIVSTGANGVYEGEGSMPCFAPAASDDQVLCLLK